MLIAAFFLVGSLLGPSNRAGAIEAGLVRPEHDEGSSDDLCQAIEARREYFYRRHSDAGVIDPARMRALIREQYEKEIQRRSRITALSIGGTNWVSIGPTNIGGRVNSIAAHPSSAGTVWVGTSSGGVWKTTDAGVNWTAQTEALSSLTVGAVAVAPSDANRVYLGTGEPVGSASSVPGIGLLRSDNGGGSWNFPSPGFSPIPSSFHDLDVNPSNSSDVLAATSNGGWRSTDAGAHWTAWVVPGGTPSIATRIVRDPTSANTVYASFLSGSTAKVLKSIDGGSNWSDFSTGLPASGAGLIALAISSDGATLYAAFYYSGSARVYKSVSGGSWTATAGAVTPSNLYFSQGNYDNAIVVAPSDANTVIVCGVLCSKTTNGGTNWAALNAAGDSYHVDIHDMRYDAGGRLYIATDGGIFTSTDHGENTTNRESGLVTAQFYDIAMDRTNPNMLLGGMQDNGTARRASGALTWDFFTGSDGGTTLYNPANPSIAWSSNQPISRGNFLWRTKSVAAAGTPISGQISPPFPASESLNFVSRYAADPGNPSILYFGTTRLWKTTTGGDAWFPLATTTTGGAVWNTYLIDALAIAPSNMGVIMVGKATDIYRSIDGGNTWTRTINGLPVSPAKFVNGLAIDPTQADVVYVALATTAGNAVYKSINGGLNWTVSSTGLPNFAAQVVAVDPTDSTTVYCGTDVGVYRSTDSGANWSAFGTGLPAVIINDLEIAADGTMLRAGTHGRGAWELTIPPTGNTPPTVSITSPATMSVALGTTVTFSGTLNDGGEKVWGSWHFPDTWEMRMLYMPTGGSDSVAHKFTRAGIWPVTLQATDRFRAVQVSTVTITVDDTGDACSSPIVVPNGALPATKFVNTETFPDTVDAAEPTPSCAFKRPGTAWFSFTAPSNGTYDFSTCGSAMDTVLSAYTGSCGSLTPVACNANIDSTGNTCPNGGATVTNAMTTGQTILLMAQPQYYYPDRHGLMVLTVSLSGSSAPTVTRIAAPAGPSSGGQSVTIYGSNFGGGSTVSLGGVAATDVVVQTPNIITAATGPHAAGTVDAVVTSSGSGRLLAAYTYLSCTYSLSSSGVSIGAGAAGASFDVTASAGCGWSAISHASWINSDASGISNGSAPYQVAANTSVSGRSGTITVGDQTFTVNQAGVTATTLLASAATTTSVSLTWTSTPVDHFEVWRNSGAGFVQIASPATASYTDSPVSTPHAYLYKVRPVDVSAAAGAYSNIDLATTVIFDDDPVVAMSTTIRAIHLTQLRTAVDAVRALVPLGGWAYTDVPPDGVPVRAIHFLELQTALNGARGMLSLPTVTFTPITSGNTVKASDVTELRNGVK